MKPVVFIVGKEEAKPIGDMFLDQGWMIGETVRGANLIQYTGGHDVSPGLYGEPPHRTTSFWPNRDAYERLVFLLAKDQGIPQAGICRGGQFLNVMSGGKLWQDVDGHQITEMHWAYDKLSKETLPVTSLHHQMMRPSKKAEILMTSSCSTYRERMSQSNNIVKVMNSTEPEVEACWYFDTYSLCFQPHPEYSWVKGVEDCRDIYFDYIHQLYGLKGKKE